MTIDLTQLKTGKSGVVKSLEGGFDFRRRIENMGIREGKKIRKTSTHFWRGPQTVKVDNITVAIGYGMAKKVIIEVDS